MTINTLHQMQPHVTFYGTFNGCIPLWNKTTIAKMESFWCIKAFKINKATIASCSVTFLGISMKNLSFMWLLHKCTVTK